MSGGKVWLASASWGPPLRLPLGADARARARAKLAAVARDLEGWGQVGMAATFDGMAATARV